MILKWRKEGDGIEAVGQRGTYRLRKANGAWWLTGVGHDELSMPALGRGRPFERQEDALLHVKRLEEAKAVEPQVGGE